MRKIFPKNNSTNIFGDDNNVVTKEELQIVVNQLNDTIQQLNGVSSDLQAYILANTESVNTNQLNAANAVFQTIQSVSATLSSIDSTNLSVSSKAEISKLESSLATINSIISDSIDVDSLTADEATIDELNVAVANIGELNLTDITLENLTITGEIAAESIDATQADIETATIGNLDVSEDLDVTGDITADNVEANGIITDELGTPNIHWEGSVVISNATKFYLGIPHFENGTYYFHITSGTNTPFATVEILNSVDNFFVRWSQAYSGIISKIYKSGANDSAQLYFEINNTEELGITLKYASECATANVGGPTSNTELPITPSTTYDVTYKDGNKFFKNVDLANQGSSAGTLREITSDDITEATDDVSFDVTEDVTIVVYKPNQSLNTTDDVTFDDILSASSTSREFSTSNFVSTETKTLSTIDLTDYDDGSLIIIRDSSTGTSNAPSSAYIKKTENDSPVLYKLIIGNGLPTSGSNTNKPVIWSVLDQALIEATNISIPGTLTVSGNSTISGTLSVTGDTTLGGNAIVSGNAVVHGDLFVDGVTHTVTEEQINTTSDIVALRQNNGTSLGNNYSGLLINKYNGTNDLALVSDSSGTMRVGTGSGSTTNYNDIYWDDDTSKWYSDSALTTEVTPLGTLTSWDAIEILGDVKHYTGAVFTQINFSGLVPLLARDEETNLTNAALMKWDSANKIAKTIGNPTGTNQALMGTNNNGAISYSWSAIGDTYSTNEHLTGGTWIDGKPIYRKVVQLPTSAMGYTNFSVNVFPSVPYDGQDHYIVDNIIRMSVITYGNNHTWIEMGGYASSSNYSSIKYMEYSDLDTGDWLYQANIDKKGIYVYTTGSYLIIEYTKL